MFTKPTLLIIGAGASADIGMPLGPALADHIAKTAASIRRSDLGDTLPVAFRRGLHGAPDRDAQPDYALALKSIEERVSFSRSIDRFVDENSHDATIAAVGKRLIAHEILVAEKNSALARVMKQGKGRFDLRSPFLKDVWYPEFAHYWLTGLRRAEVEARASENLQVISFNYDRCLELYLVEYLAGRYDWPRHQAVKTVRSINIIHPYGTVGDLPGFESGPAPVVEFGDAEGATTHVAEHIRTFTETIDSEVQLRMAQAMSHARRVIYLGFAFEPSNMRLLRATEDARPSLELFASMFRMEEPQQRVSATRMMAAVNMSGHTRYVSSANMACKQFVEHFGPTWD